MEFNKFYLPITIGSNTYCINVDNEVIIYNRTIDIMDRIASEFMDEIAGKL